MTRRDDAQAFSPSAWWVWMTLGLVGLGITIAVGAVFGLTPLDVLMGREIAVVMFIAIDYVFFAYGLWLLSKKVRHRVKMR